MMPKLWRQQTHQNHGSRIDANNSTQSHDATLQPVSKALKRGVLAMFFRTILRPLNISLKWVSHLLPFTVRTGALAITQNVLARPSRWNFLQILIATASTGFPFLDVFRPFALPLLATWLYGLSTKFLAPAHARSLQFWKRVIPIYVGYKRTQLALNITNSLPHIRTKCWNKRHEWGASKVYNLCVELRGFYLKDGQFLGARTDLVPRAWSDSLRRLQDRVPPVEFSEIEATLRDAYRINRIHQLFKNIDPTPLASATIAQVHRGEMPDGTSIVLKAQYRDQERLCYLDLLNLKRLASFLQKHDMSFFDMNSVVQEFEAQLPTEFDFIREAEIMTTIRLNLNKAGLHDVVIPKVLPGLVSRRALTMTFIDGCRPDNTVLMKLWGIKPHQVIQTIGRAFGQMLLCDGLAHCDPHLGNLLILRDGRVGFIDFGQSKEISDELRKKLCHFYLALSSKNKLYIMKTFGDLGIELEINSEDMKEKLMRLVPLYASGLLDTEPLPSNIEVNPFAADCPMNEVPIKRFNPDLFMILRTLGLLRSLTETLNIDRGDCWMSSIFRPYAIRGLQCRGQSQTEKRKRSKEIRRFLTTGIPSPFTSLEDESTDSCAIC